jgi:type I restriction enzyme M protein
VQLIEIADVIDEKINLEDDENKTKEWRLVAGLDIRAHEGMVITEYPSKSWEIIEKKSSSFYKLKNLDIVVGLVRPERRNIGILIDDEDDVIGSPDGIAIVRIKEEFKEKYPQEWLFSVLRSERLRLQFWTESGGTTYGKLTKENIENVLIPIPNEEEITEKTQFTKGWVDAVACTLSYWKKIWDENDRKPMINSPIFGLGPE